MNADFVIVCIATHEITPSFSNELHKLLKDTQSPFHKESHHYIISLSESKRESLNSSLMALGAFHLVDIGLIPKTVFASQKGLVVFDMDSTLITAEVIDEMAVKHGIGDQVKLITVRAMNGELNFDESLTQRVSLLKGFHRKHMEEILHNLKFTPGTPEFIKVLQSLGIKTAIASGGFQYFARSIQSQLKMDYVFANDLEFDGDLLTGKVKGPIVNAEEKKNIIVQLAAQEKLSLDQVVAIGDGANDIPMLMTAGLGIAIHAKEKVQKTAHYRINFGPMTHALSYMNHETF